MQRQVTDDVRRGRNYPDQPPLIPHSIEGYALDLNANKCLSCHARKFTEQSQAPMISVTHYQDRDGNFLGGVAPRRYVCLSCHVPQTTATPLVRTGSPTWTPWPSPTGEGAEWRPSSRGFWATRGCAMDPSGLLAGADAQPRLPDAWRLRRRRVLLGRLQHRPGGHQHREVLHQLPRDEGQRLRGAEGHDPFHQPLGVRATCPDCHVPHNWTNKIARKMQASKEVWGHIFGSIDTRDKFLALRKHLAEREWERMKANDSLECRNCHSANRWT